MKTESQVHTTDGVALKRAILDSGLKQSAISARTGINLWRLNRIVNGHLPATALEQRVLAVALNTPVHELFPEVAA